MSLEELAGFIPDQENVSKYRAKTLDIYFNAIIDGLTVAACLCENNSRGRISRNAEDIKRYRITACLLKADGKDWAAFLRTAIQADADLTASASEISALTEQQQEPHQAHPATIQSSRAEHGDRMRLWAVPASRSTRFADLLCRRLPAALIQAAHAACGRVLQARNSSGRVETRISPSPQTACRS